MMRPIRVEVIAPMLSSQAFGCRGCGLVLAQTGIRKKHHDSTCEEFPEHWRESVARVVECLEQIRRLYKHRVHISVIDALSPLGLWKQLRHRLFHIPAFVVDGKLACTGGDCEKVEALIDRRLEKLSGLTDANR